MRFFAGVDGGGTRTTVVVGDGAGAELARREGAAGLVDPRDPVRSAAVVAQVVRDAARAAGVHEPLGALCAGLAGVGNEAERAAVEGALLASGVAARVRVVGDGEIALQGALGSGAGVLLVAGTGSIAYGRAPDGRMARSGGWGMVLGDEGSGYSLGRAGLNAALRGADGRSPATRLLPVLLEELALEGPAEIPPWAGRAAKHEIAALSRTVLAAAAAGDEVAAALVRREAAEAALHVRALGRRLGPWPGPVPTVFHGGVLNDALYARLVRHALEEALDHFEVREAVADSVSGALALARALGDAP